MKPWLVVTIVVLSLAAAASLTVGLYFGLRPEKQQESPQQAQALGGSCARVRDHFRREKAGVEAALCWINRSMKSEGNCDLLHREVTGGPVTANERKKVTGWRLSCKGNAS